MNLWLLLDEDYLERVVWEECYRAMRKSIGLGMSRHKFMDQLLANPMTLGFHLGQRRLCSLMHLTRNDLIRIVHLLHRNWSYRLETYVE